MYSRELVGGFLLPPTSNTGSEKHRHQKATSTFIESAQFVGRGVQNGLPSGNLT